MAEGSAPGSEVPCPNCGTRIHATNVYCTECGTKVRITDSDQGSGGTAGAPGGTGGPAGETGRPPRGAGRQPGGSGRPPRGGGRRPGGPAGEDDRFGESREAFRRRVRDRLVEGWEVEHDGGDSVVLVDRSLGSPWAHIGLFLFTGGLGNVAYAWYKHESDVDRLVMRRGERAPGRETAPAPVEYDPSSPSVKGTIGGLALVLLGVYVLATSPLELGSVLWAVFLMASGAFVMPQVRERLSERHPLTTFGSTRTTDETVVHEPDAPCSVCMSPIETGIRRAYKEEQVFAGVPLYTTESGENHYCQSCAETGTGEYEDPELAALIDDTESANVDDHGAGATSYEDPGPSGYEATEPAGAEDPGQSRYEDAEPAGAEDPERSSSSDPEPGGAEDPETEGAEDSGFEWGSVSDEDPEVETELDSEE